VFLCLASFVFFPVLYCCKLHLKKSTKDETDEEGLEDQQRIEVYGGLMDNLDLQKLCKRVLIATPMMSMLLRSSLISIATFFTKPDLQVFLIMHCQLAYSSYIAKYSPFEDKLYFKAELLNELSTLVFIYSMLLLTDFIPEKET